jgi:hypothetical protein
VHPEDLTPVLATVVRKADGGGHPVTASGSWWPKPDVLLTDLP